MIVVKLGRWHLSMFRHYLINLFRPYLVKVLNYGDIGIIWRQKTSKLLLLLNHFLQIPWPSHQPEASFLQFVLHWQGKVPYYIYIYMSSLLEREQRKGPWRYKDGNFVSAVLFSYFFFSFPPLYMSFCLKALAGKGKNCQRKSPHLFSQQCIQAVYLSGI